MIFMDFFSPRIDVAENKSEIEQLIFRAAFHHFISESDMRGAWHAVGKINCLIDVFISKRSGDKNVRE